MIDLTKTIITAQVAFSLVLIAASLVYIASKLSGKNLPKSSKTTSS